MASRRPGEPTTRTVIPIAAQRPGRLQSLDAFRGITIAAMILVNNPGAWRPVYAPLQHADWNGWTSADLIFPFFLFIVGVAITLSLGQRQAYGDSRRQLLAKIVRRTVIIFTLGLILNAFPYFQWDGLRIPGVLQRIALCYFGAAVAVLALGIRGQAATTVLLLAGYWALMKLVPVPGFRAGRLGPGLNLAGYVDDWLMHGHLLRHHWDPEGALSTLPALATTLSGVLTGHWLQSSRRPFERVAWMFVAGTIALVLGEAMSARFPINKNLWTSSYVVFTTGMALNCLGMCYWLIDIEGCTRWAKPFVVYGTNPILAYLLSSFMGKVMVLWRVARPDGTKVIVRRYIFETCFLPLASPINASLLYAVAYVLLWLGAMAVLYRRRIFIKI
jgi:predicted acyltransferase